MIEVTQYKQVGKGSLMGIFSVKMPKWGDFYIKKMCYFKDGGKRWVSFPSEVYEKDGQKKYSAYNGFTEPNVLRSFQEKCLAALDEYLKNH